MNDEHVSLLEAAMAAADPRWPWNGYAEIRCPECGGLMGVDQDLGATIVMKCKTDRCSGRFMEKEGSQESGVRRSYTGHLKQGIAEGEACPDCWSCDHTDDLRTPCANPIHASFEKDEEEQEISEDDDAEIEPAAPEMMSVRYTCCQGWTEPRMSDDTDFTSRCFNCGTRVSPTHVMSIPEESRALKPERYMGDPQGQEYVDDLTTTG